MEKNLDAEGIAKDIVKHTRDARFKGTDLSHWENCLKTFIEAQNDVRGHVVIKNLHRVGTAAGGSNGTLLFTVESDAGGDRIIRNLVLRFQPEDGLFKTYDVAAQFNIQKALCNVGIPAAKQLWLDSDGKYLGVPGYVMEQVSGESPPMAWMVSGIIAEASVENRRAMLSDMISTLARIHSLDLNTLDLDFLNDRGEGNTPLEREINWYWDSLCWKGGPEAIESLKPLRDWLIQNQPDTSTRVLAHGDSNIGNYMFHENRVSAVVDWEMAFIGTPECDLSFLVYGNEITSQGVDTPQGIFTEAEFKEEYEKVSGRKLVNWDYYYTFSVYRLAVIITLTKRHLPKEFVVNAKAYFQFFEDRLNERYRLHGI